MKKNRNNSGFTMMEMLIAVAIMVVIMAVAFIAVNNYQRGMKQLELDKTAREIYIAAQNHLTMAKSMGRLDKFAQTAADATPAEKEANALKVGVQETYEHEDEDGKKETRLENFFAVAPQEETNAADTKLTTNTVLKEMLPKFSIDDTVRTGGSYIIEYDLGSAKVQSVFYCDLSNLSDHKFTNDDISELYPAYCGTSNEQSTKRRDGYGENKAILGWYGGDDLEGVDYAQLYAPEIEVINAERLEVKVKLSTTVINRMSKLDDVNAVVKIIMTGVTSGAEKQVGEYTVSRFGLTNSVELVGTDTFRWEKVTLDSVTDSGMHFSDQWCQTNISDPDDIPFIPGEDVKLYAVVESTARLANLAQSSEKQTNSLFASVKDETGDKTATVTNFRHLENLDQAISGYKLNDFNLKKAEQGDNLTWSDFMEKTNKENTQIYALSGTTSKVETYMPVNLPTGFESYDGKGLYIDGVNIDTTGNAGLFTTLNACSVTSLELTDFNVTTAGNNLYAGSLAGAMSSNASVNGVLVREKTSGRGTVSATGVAVAAGGLVGYVDGSTISNCAASVITSVEGTASAVGGLVGYAIGTTNAANIQNSYSGGHTTNGAYIQDNPDVSTPSNPCGAGGLVGMTLNATTIANCYATTSVSATGSNSALGGLVGGFSRGGTITNSYCTGLVSGTGASRGAFIGLADDGVTISTDAPSYYYSIINGDLLALGSGSASSDGVTAFDASVESYGAFMTGHETPVAHPYDSTLATYYNNVYPLKTIKEMDKTVKEEDSDENPDEDPGENSGEGSDENPDGDSNASKLALRILSEHYGDWPSPETMLLNTKSST